MKTLESITSTFPISTAEYEALDQRFGKLAYYAAWQLKKKNSKNCLTNDPEDDVQELRIALMRAGSYFKRQSYIESCLDVLTICVKDKFIKAIVKQLKKLWADRRKHGANRQRYGLFQELIMERLVRKHVPRSMRPDKNKALDISPKFATYAKQIIWNAQKSLGKQITREKDWRKGLVSLSEFDYLAQAI